MQYFIKLIFMVLIPCSLLISSCAKSATKAKSKTRPQNTQTMVSGPPLIIYKTKADYSKQVPITLSDDKLKILSYPDLRDIYYKGTFAYPTVLIDGYLLDNRGIDKNVAFLTYTYEEYSKLAKTPKAAELMLKILDPDPLLEMYRGGDKSQYEDPVISMNMTIKKGGLESFERLK